MESARYAPQTTAAAATAATAASLASRSETRGDAPPTPEERAQADALVVSQAMARARRHPVRLKAALWPGAGTRSLERSVRRPAEHAAAYARRAAARRRPPEPEDDPTPHRRPEDASR